MKTTTTQNHALRRATGLTLIAAAALTLAAQSAFAQEAPPDAAPATAAAPQGTPNDPPGRVARLDYTAGAVTTEPAGANDWAYAQINRPLTTGDQLWNDQNARSELHIGSTAVRLSASTSLDILNLDDTSAQLKVAQGTLSTRVRELAQGSSYEIDTPNLALGINGPGDYRVDVAPDGSSTTVTVRSGSVTVYGDNGQVPVAAGQQMRFAGTALQQVANNGAPGLDAFDQWAAARDAAEDRSVSARYVSREVPGYEDLDANGRWRSSPQYGEVWVPNAVPTGWAPYHDGHWVWQAPWGWTWVDDAPWGFAPYHYGRWAYVDDSWAWVPGPVVVSQPPVYAPALVAFVGNGGGGGGGLDWGVSLAIGGAAAAGIAWFPLGPGEAWHPQGGGWSPRYYNRVNDTVVVNNYNRQVNVTNINVHNTYINYRAPGAVTAVAATAFVHGQPVGRFAQKVDPQQWRNPQFNPGAPRIAPVSQSFASGMRNANYRPPAAVMSRSVVATRTPAVPPAYHDTLAQHYAQGGARVPGAGEPVIRTSVPAHFVGTQTHGAPGAGIANVRVVQSHAPGMMPGEQRVAQGAPGAPGAQHIPAGAPGAPGAPGQRPGEVAPNGAQAARGMPEMGRPGAPGAPGQAAQMANQRPEPNNGVPRPPQAGGVAPNAVAAQRGAPAPAGQQAAEARHEPAANVPHPPMTQEAAQHAPQGAQQGMPQTEARGGEPMRPQPGAMAQRAPEPAQQPREENRPQQMSHQPEPAPRSPEPQQTARAPEHQPQAQAQPRQEFHPQQAQQPRQEPRPEPRPQQAQQPRQEPRPQEPRPQQAHEQPHPEQHQPQQAQHQQPHQDQHSNNGHDEHHRG
ncbi:DUF6600 domain-containing protein [Paraburkholderia sp. DHOC27]|uniref:DUF6600 domain-containing protein n=1 Tax=Paraburkholderia sp. DHOC27 TaxID=2303330 RepID=UPI000E3B6B2C|nr:DUF6600 domain-containing protein [Paraburkholderia sp. DHOC27]RFU46727.1 FecR protein [Paraburkholderia sp. DHOC27]